MFSDMLKFDLPKNQSSVIKVLGVGGGGSNAVNHMYNQGIEGVDFIICNTDNQALEMSPVPNQIQLGSSLTEGRGAGSIPAVGKNSAIEAIEQIKEQLSKHTKMLFITAGMGGGTGTGAAPIIAEAAREMDILTVGIVTVPFSFEGRKRRLQANEGILELKKHVDTLLIVCNDRLRELYGNLPLSEAFSEADNILTTAAKGIAEIITVPGYINVDFEDVKTVMSNSGVAIMGSGKAEGENRALKAVEEAISSPLLNDNEIKGASNILLNITSGVEEISMDEVSEITDYIQEEAGQTAEIIWGNGTDETLGKCINVTLVATGFDSTSDLGYDALVQKKEKKYFKLDSENKVEPKQQNPDDGMKLIRRNEPEIESEDLVKDNTIEFEIEKSNQEIVEEEKIIETSDDFVLIRKTKQKTAKQIDIEEAIDENEEEKEIESKLLSKNKNRIERLKDMSMKLKTPQGISDMENEPAYKRRNIKLNKVPNSSDSTVSRYTLSEDDDNNIEIKSNNSFLHDNVD